MIDETYKKENMGQDRPAGAGPDFEVSDQARRQAHAFLSNYTSDVSGVCSALYELGGMVVMHDPSGCNSTYNTHDEPRWYDKDSLIFISGLSQIDAIMGNDDKLIDDIVRAARDLKPAFIALVRTPIPMMTGTDFDAIARIVELETGIPTWYFPTSGMNSYIIGAGTALEKVASCLVEEKAAGPAKAGKEEIDPAKVGREEIDPSRAGKEEIDSSRAGREDDEAWGNGRQPGQFLSASGPFRVNLLGLTPLDFSVGSGRASLLAWLRDHGFIVQSVFAMGDGEAGDLRRQIGSAGLAHASLVVSSVGLPAARVLEKRFGIPYVTGLPCGQFGPELLRALTEACMTGSSGKSLFAGQENGSVSGSERKFIIGEPVEALSLARAADLAGRRDWQVICPLELDRDLESCDCLQISSEADLMEILKEGDRIVADPIYRRICPDRAEFISWPHEAYSGRIYRRQIPDLLSDFWSRLL